MAVRTLSGATVTLVGRGVNYISGDAIIPSFVDADGTQYFFTNNMNGPASEVSAIIGGVLVVDNDVFHLPFEVDSSRFILINNPSSEFNTTSALVFAKRCGIDVSLWALRLYNMDEQTSVLLSSEAPRCADGVFALISQGKDALTCAAFVEEGWGIASPGFIGCAFERVEEATPDFEVRYAGFLADEHDAVEDIRIQAHNAWVFVLAGVPESVFAAG